MEGRQAENEGIYITQLCRALAKSRKPRHTPPCAETDVRTPPIVSALGPHVPWRSRQGPEIQILGLGLDFVGALSMGTPVLFFMRTASTDFFSLALALTVCSMVFPAMLVPVQQPSWIASHQP
eukprot:1159303-Pelagomonas_calceolata.AAC.4